MNGTVELRLAYLEQLVEAQTILNSTLFKLILNSDPPLQSKVADTLRLLQINPATQDRPALTLQISALRSLLSDEIPQEAEQAAARSYLRPVE